MSCPTKIVSDIVNDCAARPVKGVKPLAYYGFRKDITFTKSANVITGVSVYALGVIESTKYGLNAGHELVSYEDNPDGYKHKFSGVIQSVSADMDQLEDIVVFVQSNAGVWLAYGVEQGLWKVSQAKMSNDNLATIAFELASRDGQEEMYSEYVVTADLSVIPKTTEYEIITGLSIGDGSSTPQVVFLETSGNNYIVLPDGTILSSTNGGINTVWEGSAGSVILIVPKNSTYIFLTDGSITADFIGVISSIYAENIIIENTANITGVDCPELTALSAANCAITTANANTIFINALATGEAGGSIDVGTQSTGLSYNDLSTAAKAAITALLANGWLILIDDLPT